MMSPDAGGTDQVSQNRGYVAIPEVGDPEKPTKHED